MDVRAKFQPPGTTFQNQCGSLQSTLVRNTELLGQKSCLYINIPIIVKCTLVIDEQL